jgi:hypothetical protein
MRCCTRAATVTERFSNGGDSLLAVKIHRDYFVKNRIGG